MYQRNYKVPNCINLINLMGDLREDQVITDRCT